MMENEKDISPKGLCTTMCPKKEFLFRRKNNLIHKLEKNKEGKVISFLNTFVSIKNNFFL